MVDHQQPPEGDVMMEDPNPGCRTEGFESSIVWLVLSCILLGAVAGYLVGRVHENRELKRRYDLMERPSILIDVDFSKEFL